ncbi:hypothetical protein J1N35_042133 [Gossypium stocksii]|uniref:Uncharacterized protein n=1 Tax=Gossypium stocksii TaxID=47602 RepID=A0A9D3ZJ94_9ROSI|nr:hypothetical protein J1N35_042133 [Gossypium stocksii]
MQKGYRLEGKHATSELEQQPTGLREQMIVQLTPLNPTTASTAGYKLSHSIS